MASLRDNTLRREAISLSYLCRILHFIGGQLTKTIGRPLRLFFVPLLLLSRVPPLLALVVAVLPIRRNAGENGKAFRLQVGNILLHKDCPEQAWKWTQRVLRAGVDSIDEYFLGAVCLYQGLGRPADAASLFARVNQRNVDRARSLGLGSAPYRVVDKSWTGHLGDLATLDYVIKLGILEGRRPEDTILYLPPGSQVANKFLLQQIVTRLRLVEGLEDLPFVAAGAEALQVHYQFPRLPDGRTSYFWEIASDTYKRWEQEGRGPLFALPVEIAERGWAALRRAGIPKDAWFVALHVREGRWDGRSAGMHGIRNADLSTYFPAIAAITRRGGWVLRMGDPSMRPLPPIPNVVDYCHSEMRADWMDIFIVACCRFMVATISGPAFVAPLYGTRSVLTNWWPPAQRPWLRSDIFIPKLARKTPSGRYLTISEWLCEPVSYCYSRKYLEGHEGIQIEDNDSELIRDAVEEMLSRADQNQEMYSDVSVSRLRADKLYEAHGISGMSEISSGFLRRYADLIV